MDYTANQASMQISHLQDLSLLALHLVRCYGISQSEFSGKQVQTDHQGTRGKDPGRANLAKPRFRQSFEPEGEEEQNGHPSQNR